jgi:hypothetical protein
MAAMKLKNEKLLESSFSLPISLSTLNFSFAYCPQATHTSMTYFLGVFLLILVATHAWQ